MIQAEEDNVEVMLVQLKQEVRSKLKQKDSVLHILIFIIVQDTVMEKTNVEYFQNFIACTVIGVRRVSISYFLRDRAYLLAFRTKPIRAYNPSYNELNLYSNFHRNRFRHYRVKSSMSLITTIGDSESHEVLAPEMEWKREMTLVLYLLVVMATAAWASSKEIAQELMDSHIKSIQENRRTVRLLKNLLEDMDLNMETVHNERAKRCVNTGDDSCANGYIPDSGNDDGYFNGGNNPGKRATLHSLTPQQLHAAWLKCWNTGDDSCANVYIPDSVIDGGYLNGGNNPGKRCVNTGDDSCANGYIPDSGNDDGYFNGGNNPGKRATLHGLTAQQLHAAWLKCWNTGDDSCGNGYIPPSGTDDDYLNGGNNPGKRCVNTGDDSSWLKCWNTGDDSCGNGYIPPSGIDDGYLNGGNNPGKRCVNTGDDSCANGYIPDSGNDDGYFNGGNNPGKRATLHGLTAQQLHAAWLKCWNTGDDSCGNGYIPPSGTDDDYLNGGNNPGKRCVNTGDDSCANGYIPDSGNDDGYFNGGNNPGKRSSLSNSGLKRFCAVFPMSPACRNL
ncbi:hypothetical protein ANN_25317 [Periplaneta americana]|uniref:Temptin n=1 Tax=Periplaneta americana TaxID=6978 RepID=A0ABQ8S151_PERAM|nr:hypothetical protein ANN_25317 [Periplaneta americana]